MIKQNEQPIFYNGSGSIKAMSFKFYKEWVVAPKVAESKDNLPKYPYFPYFKN